MFVDPGTKSGDLSQAKETPVWDIIVYVVKHTAR